MLTELDNDIMRFPNERSFVSMLGLIPTCHDSGDKKVSGGENKQRKQAPRTTYRGSQLSCHTESDNIELSAYYSS